MSRNFNRTDDRILVERGSSGSGVGWLILFFVIGIFIMNLMDQKDSIEARIDQRRESLNAQVTPLLFPTPTTQLCTNETPCLRDREFFESKLISPDEAILDYDGYTARIANSLDQHWTIDNLGNRLPTGCNHPTIPCTR